MIVASHPSEHTRYVSIAAISLGLLAFAALFHAHWIAFLAIPGTVMIFTTALSERDGRFQRFLAFSALIAFGLLAWDWVLIRGLHLLRYPDGGDFLVRSPVYMPFAWTVTLCAVFGFTIERRGPARNIVLASAFYAIAEMLAVRAGWWSYTSTAMIARVPLSIIVCYPLLFAAWIPLCRRALRGSRASVLGYAAIALAWNGAVTAIIWTATASYS